MSAPMRILALALSIAVLLGCTGGTTGGSGGGSGGSGGAGGGAVDAGPPNPLPGDFEGLGHQVLIAPDGGAVVVGAVVRPDSGTAGDLMVARFSGTLARDPGFGTDGLTAVDFDGGSTGLLSRNFDFGAAVAF